MELSLLHLCLLPRLGNYGWVATQASGSTGIFAHFQEWALYGNSLPLRARTDLSYLAGVPSNALSAASPSISAFR